MNVKVVTPAFRTSFDGLEIKVASLKLLFENESKSVDLGWTLKYDSGMSKNQTSGANVTTTSNYTISVPFTA